MWWQNLSSESCLISWMDSNCVIKVAELCWIHFSLENPIVDSCHTLMYPLLYYTISPGINTVFLILHEYSKVNYKIRLTKSLNVAWKGKLDNSALKGTSVKATKRPETALKNLGGFIAERKETLCIQQLLLGWFTSQSFIADWQRERHSWK